MKRTVYLETSVISYRVARPSRDIIVLARQEIAAEWWNNVLKRIKLIVEAMGYTMPVVCTPEELMEEIQDE